MNIGVIATTILLIVTTILYIYSKQLKQKPSE
jgi:hypothetical protein